MFGVLSKPSRAWIGDLFLNDTNRPHILGMDCEKWDYNQRFKIKNTKEYS